MTSLSAELLELLRSLHIHTLKDEEMLLIKDPKRTLDRKDGISQVHYLAGKMLKKYACLCVFGGGLFYSWVLSVFYGVLWFSRCVVCSKCDNRANFISSHKLIVGLTKNCICFLKHV